MLLFLILIALFILLIFAVINDFIEESIGILLIYIFIVVIGVLGLRVLVVHASEQRSIQEDNETYNSLSFRYKLMKNYKDEKTPEYMLEYAKLHEEIEDWNHRIDWSKDSLNSLWFNWFVDEEVVNNKKYIELDD